MCGHSWLIACFFLFGVSAPAWGKPEIAVSSLAELAMASKGSEQVIVMKPGSYQLTDYLPLSGTPEKRKQKDWPLFSFTGSNNMFRMEGVVIEVDTALRAALRPPVHTDEFVVTGASNIFQGVTITNIGNGTSPGGAALAIRGDGNTLRDCTLYVRGSFPYGYGDLFGKGGPDVIAHKKKSGLLVTGNGTSLFGCKLYMQSFGHGYFVQKDAGDVRFEDCYVEGVMRATDDMLQETSGPAHKVGFRTVAKNRDGVNKVTPGYMKSLSEDGFRTYGQHRNLSFKNCTAKNMRGGFELRTKTSVQLEGCTAIGCERAFWISSGTSLKDCRGDAQYGPLLFVEGENASAKIELLPAQSEKNVHALATIQGKGHQVTIKASGEGKRSRELPILVGFGTPMMGEGMAPIPERDARNIVLRNETSMPLVIGVKAAGCEIMTRGVVKENSGKNIQIRSLAP